MPAMLSPGRLIDETLAIYRRNFLLFLGISAIPYGALLLLLIRFDTTLGTIRHGLGIAGLLGLLFTIVAIVLAPSIVTAATAFAVSDIYQERTPSIKSCFSRVSGKAIEVLAVSFILWLIVTLGLLMFLAPGVYWAGVYGVAIPAAVLENIPVGQALSRSSRLTQNFIGRVTILYFLTWIFYGLMKYPLNAGMELLWPIIHPHFIHLTKLNLQDIGSMLAVMLFGPISAIGLTLTYYDLRVRKEAFDLMMDLRAGSETVSAESARQPAVGSR